MASGTHKRFWVKDPDNQWSVVFDKGKRGTMIGLHWGDKLYPTHSFMVDTKKLIEYLSDKNEQ